MDQIRELYLQYLGGLIDGTVLTAFIKAYVQKSNPKVSPTDQDAMAKNLATEMQAKALTTAEDNTVKNYRQQVTENATADSAVAGQTPTLNFPPYKTEADMNAKAKTATADQLLAAYKADPNSTPFQDVVKAYMDQQGLTQKQAEGIVNGAITNAKGEVSGLDINQPALQFIPGVDTPDVTNLTNTEIFNNVKSGLWTVGQGYNALISLDKYTPDSARNKLIANKAAPPDWKPNFGSSASGNGASATTQPSGGGSGGILGSLAKSAQNIEGGGVQSAGLKAPPQIGPNSSKADLQAYARQVAQQYGIPVDAFLNNITGESAWDTQAGADRVGTGGAVGLGQMIKTTAEGMGVTQQQLLDDPALALRKSAELLYNNAVGVGGDWRKAFAQYYIGPAQDPRFGSVDWNSPDWLQQANNYATKVNAYYGTNGGATVSDYFKSHNLTDFTPSTGGEKGPSGRTVAEITGTAYKSDAERTWYQQQIAAASNGTGTTTSADTTTPAAGSTATASTDTAASGWSIGSDGTPVYNPEAGKKAAAAATATQNKADEAAAIAAYKSSHPGANVYSTGTPGKYLVEDPNAPFNAADKWSLTYNPNTGQVDESNAGIDASGKYGSPIRASAIQPFQGTANSKALMAADPEFRRQMEIATFGQPLGLAEENAWLGTSVGTNQSQDYADLQKNRQTFADTGKLYQDYTAQGGVGTNTPINQIKSLKDQNATALTPNERAIYDAYGPSAFKPSAITTKMQDPQTGEMVPVIGGNSATPLPQAGTQVQVTGPDGTMQMVDAQQKALADFRNSTPEGQGQDNGGGGDVTQQADYQHGAADAQAAYDKWVAAGMPTDKIPIPTGTSVYTSAWRQIWDQLEQQRAKGVQNQGGYITRYFGSPDTAPTGTPNIPVAQIANAPEAGPKPDTQAVQDYSGGYTPPPKPTPPPPMVSPPPIVHPIGRPVPDQPVQFQATGAENFVGVGYNGTHGKGFMNAGPVGVFDLNTGALRGVMGEAGGEKLISVPITPPHPIDEKKRRLLAMMAA